MNSFKNTILGSPYFIYFLMLFFGILIAPMLLTPPDRTHTWRQSDTAAIARNYYEEDSNFFYPRIDTRENTDGITGGEFPIFNYLAFLSYKAFGMDDRQGKALSLAFGLGCLFIFNRWALALFEKTLANAASAAFMASPMLFGWTPKFMPETCSLFFHLLALYLFTVSIKSPEDEKGSMELEWKGFYLSAAMLSIAMLIRPWQGIAGLTMLLIARNRLKTWRFLAKPHAVIFLAIASLPFIFWYGYWVPYLRSINGNLEFFMGKPFTETIALIFSGNLMLGKFLIKTIPEDIFGWGQFVIICGGIYSSIKKRKPLETLPKLFIVVCVVYFGIIFLLTANHALKGHGYYFLGVVPYFSIFTGYYFISLTGQKPLYSEKRLAAIFLFILFASLMGREGHSYRKDEVPGRLLKAGIEINKIVPQGERVGVTGWAPIKHYYLHRKGWRLGYSKLHENKNEVIRLHKEGMRWIALVDDKISNAPPSTLDEIENGLKPEKIYLLPHDLGILIDLGEDFPKN